jgi:hypothetical protein
MFPKLEQESSGSECHFRKLTRAQSHNRQQSNCNPFHETVIQPMHKSGDMQLKSKAPQFITWFEACTGYQLSRNKALIWETTFFSPL